jgi:hypothetical protein
MPRPPLTLAVLALLLTGCAAPATTGDRADADAPETAPERFTIVPDDYHVPYAGTAEDGRRFFLSDELFEFEDQDDETTSYVGLFLWNPDGTFSDLEVDPVPRTADLPPAQAGHADAESIVQRRLAELGAYALEPITVEPFTRTLDGVEFGWQVEEYEGTYSIDIAPGDFIAYYAPWDGLDYDT